MLTNEFRELFQTHTLMKAFGICSRKFLGGTPWCSIFTLKSSFCDSSGLELFDEIMVSSNFFCCKVIEVLLAPGSTAALQRNPGCTLLPTATEVVDTARGLWLLTSWCFGHFLAIDFASACILDHSFWEFRPQRSECVQMFGQMLNRYWACSM